MDCRTSPITPTKKVTADFIRQEVTRLGALVAKTPVFHPCGIQLHAAGDVLGLGDAKTLRESFVDELALADFREDPRKALGIQTLPRHQVQPGDLLAEDRRTNRNGILLPAGTRSLRTDCRPHRRGPARPRTPGSTNMRRGLCIVSPKKHRMTELASLFRRWTLSYWLQINASLTSRSDFATDPA